MESKATGKLGEIRAEQYLVEQGYEILARNAVFPGAEIDLIAQDGACIVFVEVKYRTSSRYGSPFEAVNARKQTTIRKVAQYYLLGRKQLDCPVRFDVVGICGNKLEHIKNAF